MTNSFEIDVVMPWVDGNDSVWQERFRQFAGVEKDGDKREMRFRDWGLLPYWFRGIETFAPWVRKIHFVTSGEKPEWLNLDCPKLNWVKHEDFIPEKYLPTFNINAIETNIHRIEGLSEHFVYFNDDMFLIREASISDFFKDGLPCDFAILDPIVPKEYPEIYVNGILALNRHFKKKEVMTKHCSKWFNLKYGKYLMKTLCLLPWEKFPGLLGAHLPQSFVKKTFDDVWRDEPDLLDATGSARFRSHTNVNQWIFRFWHIAQGKFSPSNTIKKGDSYEIMPSSIDMICSIVSEQKYKQVCINDGDNIGDFSVMQRKLEVAFNTILPNKSAFEK